MEKERPGSNTEEGESSKMASFLKGCALFSDGPISVDLFGDTYVVEANNFNLSFCVDDNLFEIRNINVRGNSGVGGKVVREIHTFADEHNLNVVASNVKDTAQGFWRQMGYQEGEDESEFFRV
jgi:hypothetical protein